MNALSQRNALISVYPRSKSWAARVSRMDEQQVYAIYLRMKQEGKIKA